MSENKQSVVTIYTDGACKGNPGKGGWGALLRFGKAEKEICGGELETTNNRMEMMAAIQALALLQRPCQVELYTDSEYLLKGATQWMQGWKKRGWKTAAKKAVKNQELWQQLDDVLSTHKVNWHWVKGHSGDPGNERADELANQGIESL